MGQNFLKGKHLNVIQAPVALGQNVEGVDEGPEMLLSSGLVKQVEALGWKVDEVSEIDTHDLRWNSPAGHLPAHQSGLNIKFPEELGHACEDLACLAQKSNTNKAFTLTLGGDHSIAIGSIGGALLARPDLGVIWVDAHGDFNTPETSPSGNIHGMPLAFLAGLMKKYPLPSFAWLKNFLTPSQLVLIGIRSIDVEERTIMKSWGVHVFSMTEIDRHGIGEVMEQAKKILFQNGPRPLHLSYDIDAVDPHFAPSTGTKVRGGLNYREAHYIAEDLANTGALVGMDLVEINPRLGYLDPAQRQLRQGQDVNPTVEIGLELVLSALGKRIY
ncbi:MAG: arginase [Bdellovibrionales bacterium]|nr:arginase [Bdellovibrionales bacterium]